MSGSMMSGGRELYEELVQGSTDATEMDTSWMDEFRVGGIEAVKKRRAEEQERAAAEQVAAEPERTTEPQDADPSAQEHDLEPETDGRDAAGQHGGSGGGSQSAPEGAGGGAATPAAGADLPENVEETLDEIIEQDRDEMLDAPASAIKPEGETPPPVSLQKTDHQEAVQQAAGRTGGSGEGADVQLPRSAFDIAGVTKPHIRSMPEVLLSRLRDQLRSAAVRELGVSDASAREFVSQLGQTSLVTAFLLAQLDVELEADLSTTAAVRLFRARDPLMGSVVRRLYALEQQLSAQNAQLQKADERVREQDRITRSVEHGISYLVADRVVNLSKGVYAVENLPLGNKDVLEVRDRARDASQKQQRLEREREGRPIR